ncbi:MAG TPA: hypothetical protein VL651_06140 [Bacteroidia bacterium]|nr:hypothetical protein [Bacteroidia bacterium]
MRTLLFFSFLFSSTFVFADHGANGTDTINQRIHMKKDGYWVKHRVNGNIKWEGYYSEGKRNGEWKFYSKDGNSFDEGQLVNGKRNGWWYLTGTADNKQYDATNWLNGKCIGGATLSW